MMEKLDIYDIVTSLLHGTLFLVASVVLFPQIMRVTVPIDGYETVSSFVFIGVAYFWGQVITSISSVMQPFLFWTWGGKPSGRVFSGNFPSKYLSADMIELSKNALQKSVAGNLSDNALFSKAMGIARKAEGSLSERHNQMYAYSRVTLSNLILISGLFAGACFYGSCKDFGVTRIIIISVAFILLLVLHWYRAKQRAFYYVREVLVVAERELSGGV